MNEKPIEKSCNYLKKIGFQSLNSKSFVNGLLIGLKNNMSLNGLLILILKMRKKMKKIDFHRKSRRKKKIDSDFGKKNSKNKN